MQPLSDPPIVTRFFSPAPALLPYVSTYYLSEVNLPKGARAVDWLHPEWANLRFFKGGTPVASVGQSQAISVPRFTIAGPTSYATRFETGTMRLWGIGLFPLGWARLIGASAGQYADRFVDGDSDPAGKMFRALHKQLLGAEAARGAEEAAKIDAYLLPLIEQAPPDDPAILAAHAALTDPDIASVAELAERLGLSERSVERLSQRAFGFPPKLLLRRQRFLRTLAHVMLDPSQRWVRSLDPQYHDQAHFARDFKRFMGMSAKAYMAQPHPFLGAAVHGRMAMAGAAMQALHRPDTPEG